VTAPEETVPRRRPGGRAARIGEAVHQAVLDLVAERGVDKVGIPEVSRRAGVQDSSVYRRWGTRENLILDVLLTASDRMLPVPDTGSLRGDLTALARALIGYLDTPLGRDLDRTLAYVSDSENMGEARKAFWSARYRALKPIVSRAVDRGELPPDADHRMALELLIAPIHFRNLLTRQHCDAEFADQLAGHVVRAMSRD
jgi:AcrR family transcriptional regulator